MKKFNPIMTTLKCILVCSILATLVILAGVLLEPVAAAPTDADVPAKSSAGGFSSYLDTARQLLSSSLDAHSQAQAYANMMPNEDPRTAEMLRSTMEKTANLINSYRQEGLSNMPALPNLPGLGAVMRLPDKLLRAELSMLQDGIKMAEEMRQRPIAATMNAPRELANMFMKMTAQLNQ